MDFWILFAEISWDHYSPGHNLKVIQVLRLSNAFAPGGFRAGCKDGELVMKMK